MFRLTIGISALICFAGVVQSQQKTNFQDHERVRARVAALDSVESTLGRKLDVNWNLHNGTPTMISGIMSGADLLEKTGSHERAAVEFLKSFQQVIGLKSAEEETKFNQKVEDELGNTHIKLDQYYHGIKVFGAQLIVHFNRKGEVYLINGRYSPSFDISLEPAFSGLQAIQVAKNHAKILTDSTSVEPIIYTNDNMNEHYLCWNVFLFSKSNATQQYIVDTNNGRVLFVDRGIRY